MLLSRALFVTMRRRCHHMLCCVLTTCYRQPLPSAPYCDSQGVQHVTGERDGSTEGHEAQALDDASQGVDYSPQIIRRIGVAGEDRIGSKGHDSAQVLGSKGHDSQALNLEATPQVATEQRRNVLGDQGRPDTSRGAGNYGFRSSMSPVARKTTSSAMFVTRSPMRSR
jgi:hypothetical protein